MKSKSSKNATLKHIDNVQKKIAVIMNELTDRGLNHDRSKLEEPELSMFNKYTPKLKMSSFGEKSYNKNLKKMSSGLQHHYKNNRHHPEFFKEHIFICSSCSEEYTKEIKTCTFCRCDEFYLINSGIQEMNLIDIIEMFCDWVAATERHDDGDIFKSLEHCREKYLLSDQIFNILKNTASDIFKKTGKKE